MSDLKRDAPWRVVGVLWSEYESVQMCVRSVWLIPTQWGGGGLQMAPLSQLIYHLKTWKTWCSIFDCIQISYGNRSAKRRRRRRGAKKKKNNMIMAATQSRSNYAFEFPRVSGGFRSFPFTSAATGYPATERRFDLTARAKQGFPWGRRNHQVLSKMTGLQIWKKFS